MQQDIANLKCRFVVRVKARIERKKKTQLDFDVIGINFSPGNNVKKKWHSGKSSVSVGEEWRLNEGAMKGSGCCDNGLSAAVLSQLLKRA